VRRLRCQDMDERTGRQNLKETQGGNFKKKLNMGMFNFFCTNGRIDRGSAQGKNMAGKNAPWGRYSLGHAPRKSTLSSPKDLSNRKGNVKGKFRETPKSAKDLRKGKASTGGAEGKKNLFKHRSKEHRCTKNWLGDKATGKS